MSKARKVVTYEAARVGISVITGFAFFVVLWVTGAFMVFSLGHDPVQSEHGRWIAALGFAFVPLLAGHSAGVSFPDAYAQGRFGLPERSGPDAYDGSSGASNPWIAALLAFAIAGVPIGLLAFWLTPWLWPASLSAAAFVTRFAAAGAVLAGATLFVLTGRRFLREAAVPAERRRFAGTLDAYLWQRHVWPQVLINLWLNAWIALVLVKGHVSDVASGLASEGVVADAFGTAFVLALAVGGGSVAYARFDVRWGVAPARVRALPRTALRVALLIASPFALAGLLYAGLAILGIEHVRAWPFIVGRGLLCGAYSGAVAYWAALSSLPAPASASVSSEQ